MLHLPHTFLGFRHKFEKYV